MATQAWLTTTYREEGKRHKFLEETYPKKNVLELFESPTQGESRRGALDLGHLEKDEEKEGNSSFYAHKMEERV